MTIAHKVRRSYMVARVLSMTTVFAASTVLASCVFGWAAEDSWAHDSTIPSPLTAVVMVLVGSSIVALLGRRRDVALVLSCLVVVLTLAVGVLDVTNAGGPLSGLMIGEAPAERSMPSGESLVGLFCGGLAVALASIGGRATRLAPAAGYVLEAVGVVGLLEQLYSTPGDSIRSTDAVGVIVATLLLVLAIAVQCALAGTAGQVHRIWIDVSMRSQFMRRLALPTIPLSVIGTGIAAYVVGRSSPDDAQAVARIGGVTTAVVAVALWIVSNRVASEYATRLHEIATKAEQFVREGSPPPVTTKRFDELGLLARRFEQVGVLLAERLDNDAFVRQTVQAVCTAPNLKDAFDQFCSALTSRFVWDTATYIVAEEDGLRVLAANGPALHLFPPGLKGAYDDKHALDVRGNAQPRVVEVSVDESSAIGGIRSYVQMPVVIAGAARAAVSLASYMPNTYRESDLPMLELLVTSVGGVLNQLHALDIEQEAFHRLSAADNMRREFVGMLAHDLRSPLTVVGHMAQLVQDEWSSLEDDDKLDFLRRIRQKSENLGRFVDDLLDIEKTETGTLAMRLTEFDVVDFVRAAMTEYRTLWPERPFLEDLPSESTVAIGDERRQWQILSNLVTNACKFSDEKSPVTVRICDVGDLVEVSVCDAGVGMSSADSERVFDKFEKGTIDVTTGIARGAGLGLYICRRLVEAQGGTISVDTIEGRGSVFTYTIPSARREAVRS